ncbi:WXG100 family type VII secretion target [Streptomyces sp. NPDC049577]|uniref:WXG100 family type VII secretion target n=1 Tax=Streptomyces sp. NPDC049577 TaxID=3155153 RepID=UPI003446C384
MAGDQKINDEAFNTFKNTIDQASQAFTANLRTLANAIANVDGGQWKGDAHAAFRAAQLQLNEDHDAVRRLIDHLSEAVAKTHRDSGANDAEIAASIKGVDAGVTSAGGHGKSAIDAY